MSAMRGTYTYIAEIGKGWIRITPTWLVESTVSHYEFTQLGFSAAQLASDLS
jgi:hypothetical protein